MRDDFVAATVELLAKRVAQRCSNPSCRKPTSGPQADPAKAINIGVAAHITGASPGGPRFDVALTSDQRRAADNGIWLCQSCSKLIDSDMSRYSTSVIRRWKAIAESAALRALETDAAPEKDEEVLFLRIEQLMPDLLDEMRRDLEAYPLRREFVVLERAWSYQARGHELAYHFDDHPELRSKLRILQNQRLIDEITFNDVKRYVMTEALARYLGA